MISWIRITPMGPERDVPPYYIGGDYKIRPHVRRAERGPNPRVRDGWVVEGLTIEGRKDSDLGMFKCYPTLAEAKARCESDDPTERPRS